MFILCSSSVYPQSLQCELQGQCEVRWISAHEFNGNYLAVVCCHRFPETFLTLTQELCPNTKIIIFIHDLFI